MNKWNCELLKELEKITAIVRAHFSKFRRMNKWFCELLKELEKLPRCAIVLLNCLNVLNILNILNYLILLILLLILNFSIF